MVTVVAFGIAIEWLRGCSVIVRSQAFRRFTTSPATPEPGVLKAAAQHAPPLPSTSIGGERQAKRTHLRELAESLYEVEILHQWQLCIATTALIEGLVEKQPLISVGALAPAATKSDAPS